MTNTLPFQLRISLEPRTNSPSTVTVRQYVADGHHVRVEGKLLFTDAPRLPELRIITKEFAEEMTNVMNKEVERTKGTSLLPEHLEFQRYAQTIFQGLFRHQDANTSQNNLIQLRRYFDDPMLLAIIFDAGEANGLQLDAMHYGEDHSNVEPTKFVGMRAPIMHEPPVEALPRQPHSSEFTIGLLGTNDHASYEFQDEEKILKGLEEEVGSLRCYKKYTPLTDETGAVLTKADLNALDRILGTERRSIWHFASHMREQGRVHHFTLDNDLDVWSTDLSIQRKGCPVFLEQPLIFLNMCNGSVPQLLLAQGLPLELLRMGAGGVIATHSLVKDAFATRFAGWFYKCLMTANSVGRALIDARIAAIECGFFGGLFYTFSAVEDFCICPDILIAKQNRQLQTARLGSTV